MGFVSAPSSSAAVLVSHRRLETPGERRHLHAPALLVALDDGGNFRIEDGEGEDALNRARNGVPRPAHFAQRRPQRRARVVERRRGGDAVVAHEPALIGERRGQQRAPGTELVVDGDAGHARGAGDLFERQRARMRGVEERVHGLDDGGARLGGAEAPPLHVGTSDGRRLARQAPATLLLDLHIVNN